MKIEENVKDFTINDIEHGLVRKTCEDITKTGTIYLIQNNINGHRYVGQTIQKLGKRWVAHKNLRFKNPKPLYRAMLEYGEEYFTITPIEINVSYDKLDELEKRYIKEYQSFMDWGKGGYNLTTGGAGKHNISNGTREKMRMARIGKYLSEETRKKLRLAHLGKPKSIEHSRKVGLANRGKPSAKTNHTTLSFFNDITKETFTGIRKDFYYKYNLDTRKVYDLLTGRRLCHLGWRLSATH